MTFDQLLSALKRCISECGCGWSAQDEYDGCRTDSVFAPGPCAVCAARDLIKSGEKPFDPSDTFNGKVPKRIGADWREPKETDAPNNYACDTCPWVSTKASRPLSRGTKVGCPECQGSAHFQGHLAQEYRKGPLLSNGG